MLNGKVICWCTRAFSDEACHAGWAKRRNTSAGKQCGTIEALIFFDPAAFFKVCDVS